MVDILFLSLKAFLPFHIGGFFQTEATEMVCDDGFAVLYVSEDNSIYKGLALMDLTHFGAIARWLRRRGICDRAYCMKYHKQKKI